MVMYYMEMAGMLIPIQIYNIRMCLDLQIYLKRPGTVVFGDFFSESGKNWWYVFFSKIIGFIHKTVTNNLI